MPVEFCAVIVFAAMFTLPGWAALAINHSWRQWNGLQRWCVAIGLSIAFYPALFYGLRFAAPFFTLGPYKLSVFLIACGVFVAWRIGGRWREQFAFDRLEWIAIGLVGMTIFTRFWVIRDQPYPAWSDSLHHALLTQLTAVQGKLPVNMEPYFPIPLGKYHLGLYSLSASVQWLAQVPAHTALLWTAQLLNGLCGLGVYLILDRKIGRLGAVVGVAIVGLLSHQPAWYVNWGRFTQISSQTVLLVAWLVTWEALVVWKCPWSEHKAKIVWNTGAAAILTGAVYLLHFRVAAFYLPLLMFSLMWIVWQAWREHKVKRVLFGTVIVGTCALIVVSPALWEGLRLHIIGSSSIRLASGELTEATKSYFGFPLEALPPIGVHVWLIYLAVGSLVIALLRRNKLAVVILAWVAALYILGMLYILNLPVLSITNMGAVVMVLYLPVGLIIGMAVEELLLLLKPRWRGPAARAVIALVLAASFVASHVRVTEVEAYRYFVTSADVVAMDWIKANTPPDARFAVNTTFWLPYSPHGTDAGYWIPYFTGRQTTVATMISGLATWEYQMNVVEMSRAEERLETDNAALDELRALGVDYIYVGKRGDFSGPGLDAMRISQAEGVTLVYQHDGVFVLQINPITER